MCLLVCVYVFVPPIANDRSIDVRVGAVESTYIGCISVALIGGKDLLQVVLVGQFVMWPHQTVGENLPEGHTERVHVGLGRVGAIDERLRGNPTEGNAVAVLGRIRRNKGGHVGDFHLQVGGVDDAVARRQIPVNVAENLEVLHAGSHLAANVQKSFDSEEKEKKRNENVCLEIKSMEEQSTTQLFLGNPSQWCKQGLN